MKKIVTFSLLLVFAALLSYVAFADEIDDMSSKMNFYFDQQDQITTELKDEVESLRGQIKGGDEIIFSLNGRIDTLIEINKTVMNQRDLFGMLIDDQVAGYKADLFKKQMIIIGLFVLIGLYVILRVLKAFEPHCKIFLFWLP